MCKHCRIEMVHKCLNCRLHGKSSEKLRKISLVLVFMSINHHLTERTRSKQIKNTYG